MKVLMYLRISSEDTDMREKNKSESNSIAHQRWLLTDFVRNHPELCSAELDELCDDGWSGKNFERPGMTELLEQVRRGAVQCIVVKDDCVIIELNAESPIKCGFCAVSSIF